MDIYEFKGKNILMLSVYLPIKAENEYLGVMGYDYQGDFMQTEALKIKEMIFDGKCEVNLVADDGNFAANSLSDTIIMKNIKNIYPENSGFVNLYKANSAHEFITQHDTLYLSSPVKFANYDKEWHINIAIPLSVVMKEVNANLTIQLFMGAILILLSIVLIVFFIGKLIKPLIDLKAATETLTTGNLDLRLVKARGDEIGSLSNAFHVMVVKLREIVSGIHNGSSQIFHGSRQISDSAQTISQGANKQASATEQVAASIEEVISAINQNSENAQHAKEIAKRAGKGIVDSQQASMNTIEAMKKIAEKTSIITQIAQKTNILAINAAIEAARAGTLGKGFGIVAAEVRNLAESSHLAAEDIVKLSDETLKMSEESGKILSGIVPDVQMTSSLIEQIATASMEQNSGIKQISLAIDQLNSITLQNSATSEELASGSEELLAQAETLQKAVEFFTIGKNEMKVIPELKDEMHHKDFTVQKTSFESKEDVFKEDVKPFINKESKTDKNFNQKGFNFDLDHKTDDDFESF